MAVMSMPKLDPKLPMASAVGTPTFNIGDADWARIERAYNHSLPHDVRQEIIDATELFIEEEVFEQTAESVLIVIKRITRYERAAGALSRALRVSAKGEGDDARFLTDDLIERHLPKSPVTGRRKLESLCEAMTSLQIACELARRELRPELKSNAEAKAKEDMKRAEAETRHGRSKPKLKSEPEPNLGPLGYREGDSWKTWIWRLTAICKQHRLPTGARTDSDKRVADMPSPFVALVRELQRLLALTDARRSQKSNHALAQMIKRARSSRSRSN
jgi:hypothetical protein